MRERTRILLLPSARTIHDQPNDARFFSFLMTVWMDVLLAFPSIKICTWHLLRALILGVVYRDGPEKEVSKNNPWWLHKCRGLASHTVHWGRSAWTR